MILDAKLAQAMDLQAVLRGARPSRGWTDRRLVSLVGSILGRRVERRELPGTLPEIGRWIDDRRRQQRPMGSGHDLVG